MSYPELTSIIDAIDCRFYTFERGFMGDGFFLRVVFTAAGVKQNGRKWYVSTYSTESEVVQTALKAVLTATEHEVREAFQYRGVAIYCPHFDVHTLLEAAKCRRDTRESPKFVT